jgi:hypothetical protein
LKAFCPHFRKHVAFVIPLELEVRVEKEGCIGAVLVDLHRVIDHEVDRLLRIDALGIAAEHADRIAHRGEVHDRRHAGEVLQQDAARAEGDLLLLLRRHVPGGHRFDVRSLHEGIVFVSQQVLEQDLEAEWQSLGGTSGDRSKGVEAVDVVALAADVDGRAAAEGVDAGH